MCTALNSPLFIFQSLNEGRDSFIGSGTDFAKCYGGIYTRLSATKEVVPALIEALKDEDWSVHESSIQAPTQRSDRS